MKRLRLVLIALVGSVALLAQSATRATAEVPFAFELADMKFAAGEYHFVDLVTTSAILLRDSEMRGLAMVLGGKESEGTKDGVTARLVFNKYGDRHFLAEVWYPDIARRIIKSKSERALVTSKLIAATSERVVVFAKVF